MANSISLVEAKKRFGISYLCLYKAVTVYRTLRGREINGVLCTTDEAVAKFLTGYRENSKQARPPKRWCPKCGAKEPAHGFALPFEDDFGNIAVACKDCYDRLMEDAWDSEKTLSKNGAAALKISTTLPSTTRPLLYARERAAG